MRNLRLLAYILMLSALLGVFVSLTFPAYSNIPPLPHTSVPEPTCVTKCDEYIAKYPVDRMDQWIYTLRKGLAASPGLDQLAWSCAMDTYKIAETDQLMMRLCREEPNTPFNDLSFRVLKEHLEQCGIGILR